jgi:hypothetical protein
MSLFKTKKNLHGMQYYFDPSKRNHKGISNDAKNYLGLKDPPYLRPSWVIKGYFLLYQIVRWVEPNDQTKSISIYHILLNRLKKITILVSL